MPPAAKKDCGLLLFDVGSSNKAELLNGLIKFATFKWFMNSKSIYRLILVNSQITDNDKNYPHIYTTDLEEFDPKLILEVVQSTAPASGKANWIDALNLGVYHLNEALNLPGLVTLQLIFFTKLDYSHIYVDQDAFQNIKESINKAGMFLYFIGPDVDLPFPITSEDNVRKCMKELNVSPKNQALSAAHNIVINTRNSVICSTKVGLSLLLTFKYSQGSQEWSVPMTFGNSLAIPSLTAKIFRKDISLKLYSPIPRSYVKTLAENREIKVEESDIVRGLLRHGKFLKLDDMIFRAETERCFDILGFTEKKYLPETYLQGDDTFYVLPNTVANDSFQIFTHLVKILHDTGKYAVAKRVYASNTRARYYALIPKVDFTPKCFVMTGIAFDSFMIPHKSEVPTQPKEKIKLDDFNKFFKSLMIDMKDNKADLTLGPTMVMDYYQQKLVNAIARKYVGQDDLDLESVDINDHEVPPDNKFLENLRNSWPVRSLDSPTKQ